MIKAKSGSTLGNTSTVIKNDAVNKGGTAFIQTASSFSPLQFDTFIPWLCNQWCASTAVIIIRKIQEPLAKVNGRRNSKKIISLPTVAVSDNSTIDNNKRFSKNISSHPMNDVMLPVTAYYDAKQQLIEISIDRSTVRVSRKVIHAFSLSIPYHTALTRFTFRRSGLTADLIYEINKLLPISNICEIIFDDSYVPEGNYYILLEQFSQLKYLSLNRCMINDAVCKKIFANINLNRPAANTLQILELGSNDITDEGARFIGSVLRVNRCLVHLNLSGNKITDSGFVPILDSLKEFPLDFKEKVAMRRRKIRYLQSKAEVYARCLNDLKHGKDELDSGPSGRKSLLKRMHVKPQKSENTIEERAEIMACGIVGEFHDPFSPNDVVFKNDITYSKGNLVLSSINIAYNNLEYPSVRRLSEVLQYQDFRRCSIMKNPDKDHSGLMRVTLDGNNIPVTCSELDDIDFYLKKHIELKIPFVAKKTKPLSQKRLHRFLSAP